jgi:hypothetical protein
VEDCHRVSVGTMTEQLEELPEKQKTELALAIAQGASVKAWALANAVNERTAYRWAADPRVRALVDDTRRRTVDRAVGIMTKRATWAAREITRLGEHAESESVKLRALQAVLSDMMKVSEFGGLELRMNEIEEQLRERAAHPGSPR